MRLVEVGVGELLAAGVCPRELRRPGRVDVAEQPAADAEREGAQQLGIAAEPYLGGLGIAVGRKVGFVRPLYSSLRFPYKTNRGHENTFSAYIDSYLYKFDGLRCYEYAKYLSKYMEKSITKRKIFYQYFSNLLNVLLYLIVKVRNKIHPRFKKQLKIDNEVSNPSSKNNREATLINSRLVDKEFGLFDHVDRGDGTLQQFYEDRLRLAEKYDKAGFYAYHTAEHHATTLGMASSPNVYMSAVAQRTKHLKFGPLVYCLPQYHPIRLFEEICMLDQMSGGRLQVGVGKGISAIESDVQDDKLSKTLVELFLAFETLTDFNLTGR